MTKVDDAFLDVNDQPVTPKNVMSYISITGREKEKSLIQEEENENFQSVLTVSVEYSWVFFMVLFPRK